MRGGPVGVLFGFEQRLRTFAARPWLVIGLACLLSLAARALLLPVLPIPKPAIQDEFSYLLAADTFASGRLANPTPNLAEHFETLQVLVRPTYASRYPPFSGLVMGFAQKLTGIPWLGVWLSNGLLCAAIAWALQGWLPAPWALAGAFIAFLKIGIVSYWTESYWGGTCAAIGGALLVGALPRLARQPSRGVAVALAAGLVILANTRPYEGLILAVACFGYLSWALIRRQAGLSHIAGNVLLPAILVLIPAFACLGYYNYRVTGNPVQLPYTAYDKQYVIWSPLLWKTAPDPMPNYSSAAVRNFWVEGDGHEKQAARKNFVRAHVSDLVDLGRFLLGWPLMLGMLALAVPLWRDPTARTVLLFFALFYAGAALDARLFPHYAAPATVLAYILAACALRALRTSWPGGATEKTCVTWCAAAIFALTTVLGLLTPANRYLFGPTDYHARAKRASIEAQLEREPGRQLVFVRYGPHHDLYEELVFNNADLDRSRIIWARSLSPGQDRQVVNRYRGREVWLLVDDGAVSLTRCPSLTEGAD